MSTGDEPKPQPLSIAERESHHQPRSSARLGTGAPSNWISTLTETVDKLYCTPGSLWELETVNIKGRPTTVWKNVSAASVEGGHRAAVAALDPTGSERE